MPKRPKSPSASRRTELVQVYSCSCEYCGRDYDDLTQEEVAILRVGGPCPSDDCPRRDEDSLSALSTTTANREG